MSKTYFNYEQQIASKDLVEAISTPKGIGPFCGFGGHSISNDGKQIIITPEPGNGNSVAADGAFYNRFYNLIHDRIKARTVYRTSESSATNFGCVSRDGYIYTSSESTLAINIEGSQGVNQDIILLAVHAPVDEAVENPVEFRAFWSQSPNNFYDLYMRSIDPGYPTLPINRTFDTNHYDPSQNTELTFQNLESRAIGALPSGVWDQDTMCLVGIYGVGNNSMENGALENYRIIPYESVFPMLMPHTTAEHGLIKETMNKLLGLTRGVPTDYSSIVEYLIDLLSGKTHDPNSSTTVVNQVSAMPKGSIIMWYGTQQTIPYGWELCDGGTSVNDPSITKPDLSGRVPVGLSTKSGDYSTPLSHGGSDNISIKIDQMPRHRHRIALGQAKWGDNANYRNFPKYGGNDGDSDYQNSDFKGKNYTDYSGGVDSEGSANPIDIRQSYTVLAFIIKTID